MCTTRNVTTLVTNAAILILGECVLLLLVERCNMTLQKYQQRMDNYFFLLLGERAMGLDFQLTEDKAALDQLEKAKTGMTGIPVALMIKKRFHLQGVGVTEMMNRVKLEEVREDEIQQLYDMQIQSFMPLYEKYHDEGSPAIESIERVRTRASQENRKYYFIVKDGARVGAINVGRKSSDPEESCFYISPLFVLPKYQNQGIGYVAIQKAFALYPEVRVWKLDTILQESGNCHLYEKCGFVRVGEEHVINEKMTLVDYEKR